MSYLVQMNSDKENLHNVFFLFVFVCVWLCVYACVCVHVQDRELGIVLGGTNLADL